MTQRSGRVILAQKQGSEEHKQRLRWTVVLGSLPLFGIVAAFGIAPDTRVETLPIATVVEQLPLPRVQPEAAAGEFWHEERVQRGDTIASLLARLEVDDPVAVNRLRDIKGARSLYQLAPGRSVLARTTEDGHLLEFRYLNASGTELTVQREGNL